MITKTLSTTTGACISLSPLYITLGQRGTDAPIAFLNADEVIDIIVSKGHPYTTEFIDEIELAITCLAEQTPEMSSEERKLNALIGVIERSLWIAYAPAVRKKRTIQQVGLSKA